MVEGTEEELRPVKRWVGRERLGAVSEVQEDLHAATRRQSLHDAFQHASLIRCDPDKLKAGLVAEVPFAVGMLRRANDCAVDHPGGEDQRSDGRRKLECARGSRTQEVSVLDPGAIDTKIYQADLECRSCPRTDVGGNR